MQDSLKYNLIIRIINMLYKKSILRILMPLGGIKILMEGSLY